MSISNKLSIQDVELKGKRVLMRVDFNVVSAVTGEVEDENRIVGAVPTIKYALEKGAKKVILMSHCGRPDGRVVEKFSLKPVVPFLEKHLGKSVVFVPKTVGPEVEKIIADSPEGSVLLLENLRFHIEEEGKGVDESGNKATADKKKVDEFRAQLTKLGDVFVNDAFGTAHRAHSSMVGVDLKRVSGLLLKKELDYFSMVLENPKRPFVAILGGAKVKDKIQVIKSLIELVDDVIIGGGMAYTFLKVMNNMEIGDSLYEPESAEVVRDIISSAKAKGVNIHLPLDFRCGDKFSNDCERNTYLAKEGIPAGYMGLDIGPLSEECFQTVIAKSKLVCWNGPMGVFEFDNFASGSKTVLDALVAATKNGCITVVGGGDSAALTSKFKQNENMSHVSTGGGASLELLEGKKLPGVVALADK
eukprot:GHVH01016684.1.p1 GENE.GHVH01016684.1~~GHVH01016684.1.p1  ORF type:complete len:417 (-),score=86.31 GHVH01016684.1:77-1327(-)